MKTCEKCGFDSFDSAKTGIGSVLLSCRLCGWSVEMDGNKAKIILIASDGMNNKQGDTDVRDELLKLKNEYDSWKKVNVAERSEINYLLAFSDSVDIDWLRVRYKNILSKVYVMGSDEDKEFMKNEDAKRLNVLKRVASVID